MKKYYREIPLSKKAIGQLVQDYNSGMSRDDLRKKFNLKNTRITRIIRTYSKPKFGNYRNQGKEKLIVKAYIDGMAISEICKKFNIGHTTVNNYRKRFNLPNR